MTKQQLLTKINELEHWLEEFQNHPERSLIEKDLRELKQQLDQKDYEDGN